MRKEKGEEGLKVIVKVLQHAGPITASKLLALVFLVDYHAAKIYGKRLTSFRYKKNLLGPFSVEFYEALELAKKKKFVLEKPSGDFELPTLLAQTDGFLLAEEDLIKKVVRAFGDLPLKKLSGYIMALPEVKKTSFAEEIVLEEEA
ncbi:MAG: DUF4065 domain-containing protein [Thermofilum sp.]